MFLILGKNVGLSGLKLEISGFLGPGKYSGQAGLGPGAYVVRASLFRAGPKPDTSLVAIDFLKWV